MRRYRWPIAVGGLLLLLVVGIWSCRRTGTTQQPAGEIDGTAAQGDDTLFYAIDGLNNLEEFGSVDSPGELLERFGAEHPAKSDEPVDPLLAAWPQPEQFRDVVDQLRQWVRLQSPPADWKLDPMVAGLPQVLQEMPQVKNLGKLDFTAFDGFAMQEAAWLRDISRSARGDVVEDLDRARNLFDWTVRNIQLEPQRPGRIPQFPRETLLLGSGTAAERAAVFMLLLRQLDIDAALLGIDEGERAEGRGKEANEPRPWCVGVLIGKEVYLFDPLLGLPIPAAGPEGVTLDETGQLAIRPATLAQVVADAKLLRRLDADAAHPYRVKAVERKRVVALLEASPCYLSAAMKLIESRLTGPRRMVLTTSPTAQAQRWRAAGVARSQLWLLPFGTIQWRLHVGWRASAAWLRDVLPLYWVYQEQVAGGAKTSMDPLEYDESKQAKRAQVVTHAAPLFRGRVLYFKGKFGEDGAAGCYKVARPSYESLARSSESDVEKRIKIWAKQDASYWFGLMAFQRGRYASAIDWLQAKTLETFPDGPWTTGARYNLARSYEASGKPDLAMLLYHSNSLSPGYAGDLLREKWLKELGEKSKPAGQ